MRTSLRYHLLAGYFITLFSFYSSAHAQKKKQETDTTAIWALLKKVNKRNYSFDSALQLAGEAYKRSERIGFRDGMAAALLEQGLINLSKGEFNAALPQFRRVSTYASNTPRGRANNASAVYSVGDVFMAKEKTDSAAFYYYKSLDVINTADTTNALTLVNIYSKLIALWVNLNALYSSPTHVTDKYTESAIAYFNKAVLHNSSELNYKAKVLINRGHIKLMERHYDSARFYYRQLLQLARSKVTRISPSGSVAATLLNIGDSFLSEKKADSALHYINLLVNNMDTTGRDKQLFYLLSQYYTGKAYCMQRKFDSAILITTRALRAARKNQHTYMSQLAHEVLAEAYAVKGNYQKAWQHQQEYITINDSLKKHDGVQAISQMEMRYRIAENKKELAEKELALTIKDTRLRNQRALILVIAIVFLLLLLIGILLYRHQNNKQRIKLLQIEKKMEISHLNAMILGEEKERRRLAAELHDGIGGLLGSIRLQLSSALKTYKTEDRSEDFSFILRLLEDTYTDLRKTAHNLMPETLQQEGLVTAARLFCNNISANGRPDILFESLGELPALPQQFELSLYRMIQELVHNIVKHARAEKALVQLVYIDNRLALTVEDDGKGFITADNAEQYQGMGLTTIRNRVKLLGGIIDISSDPGDGTSVYIEIMIPKHNETPIPA